MTELVSPRQFAQAIGVSESSVRRWADSGRLPTTRTAGGHRKIPRSEAIRYVREHAIPIVRPDLLEAEEPRHRRRRVEAFAEQHAPFVKALRDGDGRLATSLLRRMYLNGVTAAEICDGAVRQAMCEIGRLWPDDKRSILIEHRATNLCIEALTRLQADFAEPAEDAATAIGGAPEGDPYVLPTMMVSRVLADAGWHTINLGPHTPLSVLSQSAEELGPRLVWIALTAPLPRSRVERGLVQLARRLHAAEVHLVLGGQSAFRYRLPGGPHVHRFRSMSEMAGFCRGLLTAEAGGPPHAD